MTEPNTITTGILVGAGVGLTGTVMGAQIDALILGLIAAIHISIWLPSINDRLKAATAVSLSALAAGYTSPHIAGYIAVHLAMADNPDSPLRLACALAIGTVSPAVIPVAISRLQALVKGGSA